MDMPAEMPNKNDAPQISNNVEPAEAAATQMFIGDLYKRLLVQASYYSVKSKDRSCTETVREDFRDCVYHYERQAECVAHCLAKFGNLNADVIDFARLQEEVSGMSLLGRNPWAKGLDVIYAYLHLQKHIARRDKAANL